MAEAAEQGQSPRRTGRTGFGGALYTEKLWPSWWIWVVVVGLAAAGILILAPINLLAGYIAAAALFILLAAFLLATTPRIEVTETELHVGRASIERQYIGEVSAYAGEAATEQRGIKLNGLAFLCLRGWISPVIKVQITDPQDPTPYWLASTRHPNELEAAVLKLRG